MSGFVPDFRRLQTKANQRVILGVPNPPDMSQVDEQVLKAASPTSFNLVDTRTDNHISEATANACRTQYKGIGGLRKLQVDQENNTYYQPGCGWLYSQPQGTTNPIMNRGAFGTMNGPLYGGVDEPDEAKSGISFTMDLERAERNISATMAQRLNNTCRKLEQLTTENKPYFGFCKTSRRIIPIQTVNSVIQPRYPKDMQFGCAPDQILPASSAPDGCPIQEGFVSEGFDSSLAGCTLPLSKSCLMQFTREAGCTDQGSLLQALKTSKPNNSYDSSLKTNDAYQYYTSRGKLTPALFRDGSVASKQIAIEELNRLAMQAVETPSEANKGSAAAARDLCLQKDYFLEKFNFCAEITPETRINNENYQCVAKVWRQAGGDTKGKLFPSYTEWNAKTFGHLTQFIESLKRNIQSKDKQIQANALLDFIGVESFSQIDTTRVERGTEVVWIYYENWQSNGAIPIIMRCDTLLQNTVGAKIFPEINDNLKIKYLMPSNEGVAIMSAFEIRSDKNETTTFSIWTDDGFALGHNQMPGQGLNNNNDFNVFHYQPPTWHQTNSYSIYSDSSPDRRNVFTLKWFQGPGQSACLLQRNGKTITDSPEYGNTIYLTQEADAPWLQYEICSRPNLGRAASIGFFEKRWNGPCAFPWSYGKKWTLQDQQPIPSFDCESSQVSFIVKDIPARGFMSFETNSWWRTKASFAFNSMKCITLLVRPRATLSAGSMGSIMWWPGYYGGWSSIGMETPGLWLFTPDGKTYQFDFWIGNRGHSYMDCKINDWNLIVIHMICDERGLQRFAAAAAPLETLKTKEGRTFFSYQLSKMQTASGQYIIPRISNPSEKGYSGPLILGGGNPEGNSIQRYSFSGDIAWLHGFNHYLDNELLEKEINQSWRSRWPIPSI